MNKADNKGVLQIKAINDALDQLREQSAKPRKRIGFKAEIEGC